MPVAYTSPAAWRRSGPVRAGAATHGVSLRFGEVVALDRVSVSFAAGSITAVVGPSGSGKTSLLRVLAGFERPDTGTVELHGRVVADLVTWVPPERRQVGFVFQRLALFPHLSVTQNIAFGLRETARAERAARVADLLELVSLGGFERRRITELSGGEAQRVALARALAPDPEVVLLDEPFTGLDPELRKTLGDDVALILGERGATAILVTHDHDDAARLGGAIVELRAGRARVI